MEKNVRFNISLDGAEDAICWYGVFVIVKREDGYYVISEKTKKNLGGPYKTHAEAVERLRQVEFFKHKR